MDVIPLLVFCSLVLVAASILLFLYSVKQGDHEHVDRLSLLPLEEERSVSTSSVSTCSVSGSGNPAKSTGESTRDGADDEATAESMSNSPT